MNSGRGYSRANESTVTARRRDGITIQIRGNLTVLQNDSGAPSGASLIVRLAEEPGHAEPST